MLMGLTIAAFLYVVVWLIVIVGVIALDVGNGDEDEAKTYFWLYALVCFFWCPILLYRGFIQPVGNFISRFVVGLVVKHIR